MRSRLRRQIQESWKSALKADYDSRARINSERSLQAAVWTRLNAELPPDTRRMFIEPAVVCDSQRKSPDLVICNSREIIGIVELKFLPRARPNFSKDINTFLWLLKNRESVVVSHDRYRGTKPDPRRYTMAKGVLFVWAGVHAKCAPSHFGPVPPELKEHFLPLHAETADGGRLRFW